MRNEIQEGGIKVRNEWQKWKRGFQARNKIVKLNWKIEKQWGMKGRNKWEIKREFKSRIKVFNESVKEKI